ncbi:hypothetical protein R3P38DRAFT_2881241 [Favolaschia claudopus]|uniref:Uncharacterized protein n=1 Tax=Favolaschia claudopus TaxID=2862362 RepID=A0AAW0D0G0_9AGAR
MLGQAQIAKYLDQCEGSRTAIEEVLSGYIVWKYIKGATSERVLTKLRYLTIYLRVTGRRHILETAADIFTILSLEVSRGGGRVGLLPTMSVPGKAVWNQIRRAAPSTALLATDSVYGGPGPVQAFLSITQSRPSRYNEDPMPTPYSERYFAARILLRGVPPAAMVREQHASAIATTLPPYLSREEHEQQPPYTSREYHDEEPPYTSRDSGPPLLTA